MQIITELYFVLSSFYAALIYSEDITDTRAVHGDFRMGGDESPPIGGGPVGGDKGPMGGDSRVIRDNIVA